MATSHTSTSVLGAIKAGGYWFVSVAGALLLLLFLPASRTAGWKELSGQYLVYVGTRGPQGRGIYAYKFDESSEEITSLGLAAETPNPFWMIAGPGDRHLDVANIIHDYEGEKSGSVSAFALDPQSGELNLLDQVSSLGADPAYVSLDRTGRFLLVANYTGGSVAVFPITEEGRIGKVASFVQQTGSSVDPKRQRGSHPHEIHVSPDNRFALEADLGLDKLFVYSFNPETGALSPAEPPFAAVSPGAGPRHFVFSPGGKFLYVIGEMGSTITVFSYTAESGALHQLQVVSTLPDGYDGQNTGAEIAMDAAGRFLYASNRGDDTIAVFAVNDQDGTLKPVTYVPTRGKTPGMFEIDPSGAFLFVANYDSDNVVVFRVDQTTGLLTPTGQVLGVPGPECVTVLPVQ